MPEPRLLAVSAGPAIPVVDGARKADAGRMKHGGSRVERIPLAAANSICRSSSGSPSSFTRKR